MGYVPSGKLVSSEIQIISFYCVYLESLFDYFEYSILNPRVFFWIAYLPNQFHHPCSGYLLDPQNILLGVQKHGIELFSNVISTTPFTKHK